MHPLQALALELFHHPFVVLGIFEIGSLKLFFPGWLRTVTLLVSASWVARIIGVSHGHLAKK
jgi:hypothetical protein